MVLGFDFDRLRSGPFEGPAIVKPPALPGDTYSRNLILKANTVTNTYSLLLGIDSTIILQNHKQKINTQELGAYEYVVDLAFIVARGSEINLANQYDYLDGLIVYAIKTWGDS
jgi:hypothetical protein